MSMEVIYIKYDILKVSVVNMSFKCEVNENMPNMFIIAYLFTIIFIYFQKGNMYFKCVF